MQLGSYVRELPDYSIQQVERAEYQEPKFELGSLEKPSIASVLLPCLTILALGYIILR